MSNIYNLSNKKELKNELLSILEKPDWMQSFCKDENGELLEVYKDKEFACVLNKISSFGYFQEKQMAEELLLSCLSKKIDVISDWLIDKKRLPLNIVIDTKRKIGMVWNEQNEEVNTTIVKLTLRKEYRNKTAYGFYISFFHPIL